jgi:hypothetical protein
MDKALALLSVTSTKRVYNGMGVHLKKSEGFLMFFFRNPIPNLTIRPSSPAVREHIFAVIPFDHSRKKRAMMKDVYVRNARERWTRCERILTLAVVVKGHYVSFVSEGSYGKVVGKKKVMGKERRCKE